MGKHFGNLAFIRGILYYKISPHEQKPFARCICFGIPNFIPRTSATVLTWLPVFVIGYLVYETTEAIHHHKLRKHPEDYANEVDPNPPVEEEVVEKKKC